MGCWDEICLNGPHITEKASRPIYGKNLKKNLFFGTKRLMTLKHGIQYLVLEYYQICPNGDTGLTLTIFMTSSNLFPFSAWVKPYTAYSQVFIQHILYTHASDTGPVVLWFIY